MSQEKIVCDIPCDVMVDIAGVILQAGLQHRITGADAEKNVLRLEVLIPEEKKAARQNIFDIIEEYNYFRYE